MIGRRRAIAAVALAPLVPAVAQACSIQLPLPKQKFTRQLQVARISTVRAFMEKLRMASADLAKDSEKETAAYVKPGFKMPDPAPYELQSIAPFDDIVVMRAIAFQSTGDTECNPVVQVQSYYVCHFDYREADKIAMMDTISYG